MEFILKVTRGPGQGSEFPVEAREATLGRTNDNDIVVRDPSASRSHARIFADGGAWFVEDLGSANGTIVDGQAVSAATQVQSGSTITIGELEFTFALPPGADPSSTLDESEDPNATLLKPPEDFEGVDPNATLLKAPEDFEGVDPNATLLKPPEDFEVPNPDATNIKSMEEIEAARTAKPVSRKTGSVRRQTRGDTPGPLEDEGSGPPSDATQDFDVPPPRALARGGAAAPQKQEPPPMTAAERARQRRDLSKSATGKLQLAWIDLSKPARVAVAVVGGAMVLGLLGLGLSVVIPKSRGPKKAEPGDLVANGNPLPDSFGLGEGVVFEREDLKAFNFQVAAATPVVGVLHYQSKDISQKEVSISLNGSELGSIPPDNIDPDGRELDLVLPSTLVNNRESNTLVFDNVLNPPGEETWRIWNVWVELIPVPEVSPEQATARARNDVESAQTLYERREIGADNLFKAWKTYREAWLVLEATPNRPETLLQLARSRMRELRPELDQKCSSMIVAYRQALNTNPDEARSILEGIPRYFPTREHPCFAFSKALLADFDDFGGTAIQ